MQNCGLKHHSFNFCNRRPVLLKGYIVFPFYLKGKQNIASLLWFEVNGWRVTLAFNYCLKSGHSLWTIHITNHSLPPWPCYYNAVLVTAVQWGVLKQPSVYQVASLSRQYCCGLGERGQGVEERGFKTKTICTPLPKKAMTSLSFKLWQENSSDIMEKSIIRQFQQRLPFHYGLKYELKLLISQWCCDDNEILTA